MEDKIFLGRSVLILNNREVIRSFAVMLVWVSERDTATEKDIVVLWVLFTAVPPLTTVFKSSPL